MPHVLILSSTSDIANALAHEYAKDGYNLYLAARRVEEAEAQAKDLTIRHNIEVKAVKFDALDFESHQKLFDSLEPKPLGVVCVTGYLGEQQKAENDFAEARKIIDTNYTGCVSILNIVANHMQQKGEGFITGVSSVAGERGRQSNYYYGSAKAAFTAFLSGLRNRLSKHGVHVLTVKPGFVNTKMIEGIETPKPLTAEPAEVAKAIRKAEKSKTNIIYAKWMWRPIMGIIKNIPEGIFKKLKL